MKFAEWANSSLLQQTITIWRQRQGAFTGNFRLPFVDRQQKGCEFKHLASAETWPLTQNRDSTSRGCTPQVAEKDSKRLMERYGSQWKYSGANWPGEVGTVSPGMSVDMAGHMQRMSDDRMAKQVQNCCFYYHPQLGHYRPHCSSQHSYRKVSG